MKCTVLGYLLLIGLCCYLAPSASAAPIIYASGQLLVPGDPGIPAGEPGHDDSRENYLYAINTVTGQATPVSPVTSGLPSALAGVRDGRLLGFASGQLVEIDPPTANRTPIGSNNEQNSTGFEILPGNQGFLLPFNVDFETQQLVNIDLETGATTPIGTDEHAIGHAIDAAAGNPLGTAEPFIIGLGAVGSMLYGVDLDTDSLVAIEPASGEATVVGKVGAVGGVTNGLATYSGFAALTGVDENRDGQFDALFGSVNFVDDGDESYRLGGVARYDLTDGTWRLVGTNPGVIFFGFGSHPVPEPSSGVLIATMICAGLGCSRRRLRART